MKWFSREWLTAAAAQVFGLLAVFGVIIPDDLKTQIVGVIIYVGGLVGWFITRTAQKKAGLK